MNNQGWFIGPNGKFLFWVPPYLRPYTLLTDTMLVIPWPRLDVSHLMHASGREWLKINDGDLRTSLQSSASRKDEDIELLEGKR